MSKRPHFALACATALVLAVPAGIGVARAQDKPFEPDPEAIGRMIACLQAGLPENWQRAWVVVTEIAKTDTDREIAGKFFYAESEKDRLGKPLKPCNSEGPARDLYNLNVDLVRQYREASLVFYRDGKFDLRYDTPK